MNLLQAMEARLSKMISWAMISCFLGSFFLCLLVFISLSNPRDSLLNEIQELRAQLQEKQQEYPVWHHPCVRIPKENLL